MKSRMATTRNFFAFLAVFCCAPWLGAQTIEVVDYSDTFTVAEKGGPIAERTDGAYGPAGARYNVEDCHGNPQAVWTPQDQFSFNTGLGSTCCGYPSNDGNPGAESGLAQSGGTDFSFAYGLRTDYVVQMDSIFTFDRIDISSLPAPGAGIFSSPSLSVFFRNSGGFSLFNGSADTPVTDGSGTPINSGITDDGKWHRFAVRFDKGGGNLYIYVDGTCFATVDLNTFAGGIYRNFSNGAVGGGGAGYDFVNRVLWVDNFVVGGKAGLNPCFTATPAEGLAPLSVRLDATCSKLTGSPPETFKWDFGDGSTGAGEVVDHVYAAGGRYTVTLTLDSGGATASTSKGVVVHERVLQYADDFNRADGPPAGWSVGRGTTWAIAGGSLVAGPTGEEHFIFAGDPAIAAPPDSVFEFDFAFLAPGNYAPVGRHGGFQFFCNQATHRYAAGFSGYFIDWIDRVEDRGIRLTRVDSGGLVGLAAGQGGAAPADPPAHYKIVAQGGRIKVYGDGQLYIDVFDETYRGGFFGFWTWEQGQKVAIDNITLNSVAPFACYSSSPAFPLTGQPVSFDGGCSGVFDGSATIARYDWDFGDGTTESGANVAHVYSSAEKFAVTLTVEDSLGRKASITKETTVSTNLVPFAACFNGPQGAPADWMAAQGTWTVTGARTLETQSGGAEAFLYAGDPVRYLTPNFVAEVEWRLFAGTIAGVGRHAAIHFFWNKTTTNRFATDSRGYSLFYIDRASDRGLTLLRFAGGGYAVLNPPGGTPALTEPPAKLRIEVTGPRILVLADGVPVIDVADATYRDGLFALWAYNENHVGFDNVRIWDGVEPEACPGTPQINGDCNLDGGLDIGDLVCYVLHLFPGFNLLDRTAPQLPCAASSVSGPGNLTVLDVNGDGRIDVSDIVRLATYLYMGGAPPVQGTGCFGLSDFLGCADSSGCP